jgi:ribosomal protein L40E
MTMCGQCQQQNPDDANFCHQCGVKLLEVSASEETAVDSPTAQPIQNEETRWRQFIGPNADYYLRVFKKFSANGQPRFALSWNWPAFLYISFLWFLYRKMYLHAFVYAVGPMVSTYLTGDVSAGIIWSIMAGATANYLYYWHCWEHIGDMKRTGRMDPAAQDNALKESGGVQPYVIWVGVVFYIIFLATLVKMVQEGPPDVDQPAGRPAKQAAMQPQT